MRDTRRALTAALLLGLAVPWVFAQDIIIDNVDAGFSVLTGTWGTGTGATNKLGVDYRFADGVGSANPPTATCEWRPTIPTAGNYEVSVWYNHGASVPNNRATDAPYSLYYDGGFQLFRINQETGGGAWVVLGTYPFAAGTSGRLELGDNCETGNVAIADGARFRLAGAPPAGEIRGVWASRFEWPSTNMATAKGRIDTIMTDAADNNFNAVFFQVRGQCDTLYPSPYEPWSPIFNETNPGWDPLQYALTAAHSRGLQLHAYINTHTCWQSSSSPSSLNHVFYQHCHLNVPGHDDWIIYDSTGAERGYESGLEYLWMNPGVPDMDAWVRKQIIYVVSTYAVDGVHFDRVRMPGVGWGRNPITLARWDNAGTPAPNDGPGNPDHLGFDDYIRDSINRAMINICGQCWATDPAVAVSATPIGLWRVDAYPGYPSGFNYGYPRGQDGKAWMNFGAVDFLVPQIYWGDGGSLPDFSDLYPDWQSAADSAGRYLAPGSNNSNGQSEVENHALIARAGGAAGHVIWSHGSTNYTSWSTAGHPYETPASFPSFPWRATEGVIVGHVYQSDATTPVSDAWINRTGAAWTALSSGDGFYAFLRVAPGSYTVSAQHPTYGNAQVTNVSVTAGAATTVDLVLGSVPVGLSLFGNR